LNNRKYYFGACHFCICTACSRFICPFKHKLYEECYACRERGENRPRLDCDFFSHYMKVRRFRFHRVAQLPQHFGTFILHTDTAVYVGSFDKLSELSRRFGGTPKRLNIIDYNFTKGKGSD
jgi:hypothetical protein